jgi:hypothetical protein
MFSPLIMPGVFQNNRNIFFLVILFFFSDFLRESSYAQQASLPQEGFMAGQAKNSSVSPEPGLLFYLSGNKGFNADYAAGGQVLPNYIKDVKIIPEGTQGPGFSAEDSQLLSYWAPGNIYAQRGTLSFFWRSRYPVGPTPFPVFRVGYADHSSWDMVWLRIDYNGSGFDAFVTDIGLARTRVSYFMDIFPGPEEWIHLALSWDETEGIRFYVNGIPAAKQSVNGNVYDTGLDQFGPHSRIISPYQVQSAYSFMRGGDLDELRIYDRMLPEESIAGLAKGNAPKALPPFIRDLSERRWRDAWWLRHGWNLPNPAPPLLPSSETSVRKVEIHDAFDIKRWYWKANDGIRETTWPGVYNMSRLPGRYDYFVLPDWDCYSGSGQSVKFTLPDEPWNHVEMWGKAWGQLTFESDLRSDYTFGVRSQKQIKSYHRLNETQRGGKIRFDNTLIEEPIGSFEVYFVDKGHAPEGTVSENFTLTGAPLKLENKAVEDLASFIRGRYPADERSMMLGVPAGSGNSFNTESVPKYSYPFIHIMIPYTDKPYAGLDGIEIQFPLLRIAPTHNGVFPVNIRVKDPLWQMRDLADFSFSVKPGESPLLWIDTRDRILPNGRALYITIAGAGADLTPDLLKGTLIKLVYKSRVSAKAEHELDRFTQVRDLYAHIVEERPRTSRLNLYNRFIADCSDLLSVNPDHWLAQTYRYAVTGYNKPVYKIAGCPDGIPEWAFLQIEYLRHLERMITWYIDSRQIANGEFGGGLSDDGDLTNMWPGISFLGIEPEKILKSLQLHMTAYYDQERSPYNAGLRQRSLPLFTNGLATIFTDELHALEDGIQVVGQLLLLDYGNPVHMERGMETSLRMLKDITQVNSAGHRHFRSRYYGGTRIATEDPWQWSVNRSYHVLQTAYLIARYNGNPELIRMIREIADGLLAHRRDGQLYTDINFSTDKDREDSGIASGDKPWSVFVAAYHLTGDKKYLEPIQSKYPDTRIFDKDRLVKRYSDEISNLGVREYINTEGSIWIDRLSPFNPIIQEDRLGGIALTRTNMLYPQHFVSWKFNAPATYESVAIFLPKANPASLNIIAYNLELKPVSTDMTVWDVKPGRWRVQQGIDTNDDQKIDSDATESIVNLERGELLNLVFAPRRYNIVSLELVVPAEIGYWDLPDLGIGPMDVKITGNSVKVRVHSLGAVSTPATSLELRDAKGKLAATAPVPPLEAPLDLIPRWADITLTVAENTDLSKGSVKVDPEGKIKQITRRNTMVKW